MAVIALFRTSRLNCNRIKRVSAALVGPQRNKFKVACNKHIFGIALPAVKHVAFFAKRGGQYNRIAVNVVLLNVKRAVKVIISNGDNVVGFRHNGGC